MALVWLNGALVAPEEARVSVLDHGMTVGDGVFETMRTERGIPFAMTRHLRRLRRSLAGLDLELGRTDEELREAMQAVADQIDGPGRVRLTVTGGPGPLGSGRDDVEPTVFVAGGPAGTWPLTAAVVTVPWPRNERAAVTGLKTTSYAENVVALARAHDADASEAIFGNTVGQLCEGTGSNVFVVIDGQVLTPPLSSGCLAGITRELVCEVSPVGEVTLPLEVLQEADEIFLTSSTRDVQGVHRCDDRSLAAPGPVTVQVAAAFAALAAADVDP